MLHVLYFPGVGWGMAGFGWGMGRGIIISIAKLQSLGIELDRLGLSVAKMIILEAFSPNLQSPVMLSGFFGS